MKATLEFDVSDPEQEEELNRTLKAKDMALAIWRTQQDIRTKLKNIPEDYHSSYVLGLEDAQKMLNYNLDELNLDLDKLIS